MPDKLPKGWVKTTLGEVCAMNPRTPYDELPPEDTEVSFVPMAAVEEESGRLDASGVRTLAAARKGYTPFKENDVIFAKITPCMENGKIALATGLKNGIAYGSTEFFVFRPYEGLLPRFILHFLLQSSFRNEAQGKMTGAVGQKRVPSNYLFTHSFPLPPTPEQERIVAKLDALLSRVAAGEAAARRALERLKKYRTAVLHAAVTGELTREWRQKQLCAPGSKLETGAELLKRLLEERRARWEAAELKRLHADGKPPKDDKWKQRYPEPTKFEVSNLSSLPRGWAWASLQQLGFIVGGLTKNPRRAALRLKIPYLRVGNVYANELRLDVIKTIGVEKDELDKLLLEKGDLLIVEGNGSKDQIGRLAIWDGSIEKCVHQNHIIKVRLVEKALGTWILSWLLSPPGRHHVEKVASSTTGLYTLSVGKVGHLPIPLPPSAEQTEIGCEVDRRLAATDRLTTTLNRQLARASVTRQSLLREAFTGQLVPQNPNDEPASVLLERIRKARAAEAEARKRAKAARPASVPEPKKETADMNQPVPTTEDLQAAWQKIRKKPDAKKLFEAAGFALEQVVGFYEVLRTADDIVKIFKAASQAGKAVSTGSAVQPKLAKQKPGLFRLVSLWLEDFKNLKNYKVNFNSANGLDIVLGWNGTGKSNLFESLVIIFRDLHYWWEKNKRPDEPMAGYRLRYEIEDYVVDVTWIPSQMKRPEVAKAAVPKGKAGELEFKPVKREDWPLPKFVFGYYSGPTNRLADHFWPMKHDHYERLRKASSDDPETLAKLLEQRRFFCAEASHAKYVLLAFSYKEDAKIWKFLEERLRIVGFESALFIIRKPRWAKGRPEDFWGATGIMRRVMEKLKRYAIAPMVLKQKVAEGYRLPSEEHFYFFLPDLKSLHEFAAEYADARSFFLALESTDFSELIYDVKIQVRVKAADNQKIPITFRELSEGEQQLLMVLGLMRFTKSHQSLVLLDEPDTHLNPHWSVEYLKDLASVVSDDDNPSPEQQTSQLLMATHDPLVIASLLKDQVHLLKRDPETLVCRWEQATVNPKGLGFTGILTSEMFGFRSDLDPEALADLDNRVRLIAKETLSAKEKKELEEIDKRLADAGFSKAFSDPYYAAFVRAWGKRHAEQMAGKEVLTKRDREEIDRIAKEVLAEAVAEVEKEVKAHALHRH